MSKAKEAEAPAKILKYLLDTNRPYSTIDITTNLHNEFGKTCVQRTLDLLVAKGSIREKVYGKQKVYLANQDQFPTVAESELKEMDQRVTELQKQLQQKQAECHNMESKLQSLKKSLTNDEAKAQLKDLEEKCSEMEARLKKIKEGKDSVTPQESAKINKDHQEVIRHWRKRKRMTTDIVNAILEGYPKSKKQLLEEVGIETDEDYGVKLPTS